MSHSDPDRSPAGDSIVECRELTKHYGSFLALKQVSVSIPSGVCGLLGPNGAGKSTLISVLLGQTPSSSGQAHVLGLDVHRQLPLIRRRIGYMPENDCAIPGLSGTGMVHYCGRLSGMSHADSMQRTHEVLDYVGLGEARYRPSHQYSTGMRQRLKLAQAIVHDPDLIFLDEPTNGMDPAGRSQMLGLIRDLGKSGVSVILSSHLLPDVEKVCERVVIMGGGEILDEGVIDEMRQPHATRLTVEVEESSRPGTLSPDRRAALVSAFAARSVRPISMGTESDPAGRAEDEVTEPTSRSEVDPALTDFTTGLSTRLPVELPSPGSQALLYEAASELEIRIRTLEPERSSLEETFMAAIRRQAS